ncbi:MAG: endonuclease NucS domain-containing protein [Pseudomonadota bacterium]
MPIRHAIWKIGEKPQPVPEVTLGREALLERMIVEDPTILSERWLLIGRQVQTTHGGIVDLLGLNQDGQLILIELKRDKTPREVVAQALDYASWVERLQPDEIGRIYADFSGGASLGEAFERRFGVPLDEEQLDGSHQIVVVAASLDPSTERIVNYLNSKDLVSRIRSHVNAHDARPCG